MKRLKNDESSILTIMKVQRKNNEGKVQVTFIPETEEEKLIMGSLRNHYFFGMNKDGTFPKYAGITSKDDYVTSMIFEYNAF
jgi:hypothetical protein